jgi:hypothetical protein
MSSTPHSLDARKAQDNRPASPPAKGEDQETLIAELTLRKWERAGQPRGQWEVYWVEAEQELLTITSCLSSPER